MEGVACLALSCAALPQCSSIDLDVASVPSRPRYAGLVALQLFVLSSRARAVPYAGCAVALSVQLFVGDEGDEAEEGALHRGEQMRSD